MIISITCAQCLEQKCNFDIKNQYENAVHEVCEICGKSIYFKMDSVGRVNNLAYIKSHLRQVLIPQHNLFKHEYPNFKMK